MNFNKGLSYSMITLAVVSCLGLTACKESPKTPKAGGGEMPVSVDVVSIAPQPIEIKTDLPGRITAYNIAEIRPQVTGIILKRDFTEGGEVKAGQSLYQIDSATYQSAYHSAEANLQNAIASTKINQLTVDRYKPLLQTKAISQQDYDKALTMLEQSNAAVKVAKAALETAKINLDYTKVKSPIDGIIGKSSVTAGALVNANQANALATVQQLDPIYVDITQPANDYLRFKQEQNTGALKSNSTDIPVTLLMDNGTTYPYTGKLIFSDPQVNETTGSISLRAEFPNPNKTLLPGMFVRTQLTEGTQQNAILVPQQAVSRDARGNAFVMVINKETNRAKTQVIQTANTIGNDWLVTSGLESGDKVITSGLIKVRDNTLVHIGPLSMPGAANAQHAEEK